MRGLSHRLRRPNDRWTRLNLRIVNPEAASNQNWLMLRLEWEALLLLEAKASVLMPKSKPSIQSELIDAAIGMRSSASVGSKSFSFCSDAEAEAWFSLYREGRKKSVGQTGYMNSPLTNHTYTVYCIASNFVGTHFRNFLKHVLLISNSFCGITAQA
jgi:hypothetical protein